MEGASGSEEKAVWVMVANQKRTRRLKQRGAQAARTRDISLSGRGPHGQAGDVEPFVALPDGQAGGVGGVEQFELMLAGRGAALAACAAGRGWTQVDAIGL